jgi:hypothetical protein
MEKALIENFAFGNAIAFEANLDLTKKAERSSVH